MKPDPRRTEDAVKQVRSVYTHAYMGQHPSSKGVFVVFSATVDGILGWGATAKDAWWNSVPKALEKALTS